MPVESRGWVKRVDLPAAPSSSRRSGKPTIADVAKMANVSAATVSYVLNGHTSEVSEETAERVMKAVRDLGYVKNLAAAALTGQKTKLIAAIIPGIYDHERATTDHEINPFYGEFIFRLEAEARAKGYALCIYGGREQDYVNFLLQRGVDTAVLVGMSKWNLPAVLDQNDIHCVLYDSFDEDAKHSNVRTNEIKGGYLAAERLIDIRRRKLAFVGGMPSTEANDVPSMRLRGARKACEMADAPPIALIEAYTSYEEGYRAAEKVVAMGVDGVVCLADIVAAGVIEGLQAKGVRVPDDVAVMGYDNLPFTKLVRPRLSTIDQGLGEKVKAVMSMIENRESGLIKVIDPHVVLRDSA